MTTTNQSGPTPDRRTQAERETDAGVAAILGVTDVGGRGYPMSKASRELQAWLNSTATFPPYDLVAGVLDELDAAERKAKDVDRLRTELADCRRINDTLSRSVETLTADLRAVQLRLTEAVDALVRAGVRHAQEAQT